MRRQVIYVESGRGRRGGSGDREGAKWAAGIAAGVVLWNCWHFGMWGFVATAATYLVVLVVLKAWLGGRAEP
ncbi:hypothetical protein [Streptacidiphilus rugosus]|uniref:hypothetical protein n=1 Tax=Streptacidiphilus rugosus TaxID=405783 RepID=UPI000567937D|nr:hypothetical protein [Streptacidiphilus rugosus]